MTRKNNQATPLRAFNKPMSKNLRSLLVLGAFGFSQVAFGMTEEQRLLQIAKTVKPISDSQWNEIAGSKITDSYDIQKGDTLWDVSKRLFGNAYYWPKVWAFNNSISNPHVVEPGQKLVFASGSSDSIPKLGAAAAATEGGAPAQAAPSQPSSNPSGEQHEYDKLPPDLWKHTEVGAIEDKKTYDEYGMDRELKVAIPNRFAFRVPSIANDTTVPYLGEIVSSRRDGFGLSQHETVFIKSNSQDLQVGTSYTVFKDGEFVREKKSDRSAYLYQTAGEVKIVGVKDELYIGILSGASDVITRGMKIYPLLPLITDIKPLPARTALESLVILSANGMNTSNTSQGEIVHFDRGIEDGVQVGNVFRIYDYYDPLTHKKITDSDLLMAADALVIHATAEFSTAIVIRAVDTFSRGDFAVLLTDVSDLEKKQRDNSHEFAGEDKKGTPEDKELDELDELDKSAGEGLGTKEETEIKELDQWDKKKDLKDESETEPTVPSAADTPTDENEKLPGSNVEKPATKATPHDPNLDDMLDSPTVTPPGVEGGPPPKSMRGAPEQTLEAPPPPSSSEEPSGNSPSPEPMEPSLETGTAQPGIPAPSDEVRSQ